MATINFKIDGYEMFRADLIKSGKRTSGGCALYVRENVIFEQKPGLIPEEFEGICGFVTFPNKHKMTVANIYRHPKQKIKWFDKLDKLLDNFSGTKLDFIITGDLNSDLLKNALENDTKHFVYACETHQLTQLVNKPTRITPTSSSLIDMIMTTCSDKSIQHSVMSVGIADDCLVCVTSYKSHYATQKHRTIDMRNYENFNEDEFLRELAQCNWAGIEDSNDVDVEYDRWKHLFTDVCDNYCPFVIRRVLKCFLLWLNEEIKEDIKMKHYFEKIAHWSDEFSTDAFGEMLAIICKRKS